MPNWCSNDLYIYGDARKDIADFISGPEGVIDFEKIKPMPEVLKETNHGSEEREALIVCGQNDGAQMLTYPWVVDEGVSTVEQLRKFLLKRNPELEAIGKRLLELKEQTGYTNWYEWSVDHWGTKWNVDGGDRDDQERRVMLTFDTAWSPPTPIVDALSEMSPKTKFSLRYYEGGMGFKGRYAVKGGKVIAEESGSYQGRRGG